MDNVSVCQKCGKPVPTDAPSGHCPHCLLDLGSAFMFGRAFSGGTRFGDYELLELIGRGGMGMVFKARQHSLQRLVALKMLNPHAAAFPAIAERIRLEAETAANLSHPHIVRIIEADEFEGRPFFTMELIEGVGMDKLIGPHGFHFSGLAPVPGKQRGPPATAAAIMAQVARAVDHAHQHGVLHRDLKPANIVIDGKGEPHLTDFGLAKAIDRETTQLSESNQIIGTLSFMAPEQARGQGKHATIAADVYGLGAVFYAMLTGQPPFRAETPVEILEKIIKEEPRHPTTSNQAVDLDLATICLRCLEKEPNARYNSALALAEDLERWLRREPIEARPVRFLGRVRRWCLREPVLAGMTGGLLVLLVAMVVLALGLYESEKSKRHEAERRKNEAKLALFKRIFGDWERQRSVRIYSEDVALLGDRSPEALDELVVMGHYCPGNLPRTIHSFVPLLNNLQTNQPSSLGPHLYFELQIYADLSDALHGLTNGVVDFMRMDPAQYILLRQADIEIAPVAQELCLGRPRLEGVIFTREDSGITSLADLKRRSFAFGGTNSALGHYLPKAALVEAGVYAFDFQRTTNIYSSKATVSAVRRNEYAAGAAEWIEVLPFITISTNQGPRLKILCTLSCPSPPWIATKHLDRAIAFPMLRGLLESVRDTNALAAGNNRTLTGFQRPRPTDYDILAGQMEKARLFDPPTDH